MNATKRRTGGRSARVATAVLDATIAVLSEKGWERFNVAEVAERAGVHETTIYRRWQTREALVNQAILERTAGGIPVPDLGSLRADLLALMEAALGFLRSPIGGALVRMSVSLPPGAETSGFKRAFWSRRFPAILAVLARGAARGELDPRVDRQLLMEMIVGLFHLRVFVIDDPNDDGLAERAVDLVLLVAGKHHVRTSNALA